MTTPPTEPEGQPDNQPDAQPTNPYGAPQNPPQASPPAAPQNPYGTTPPPPANPYGTTPPPPENPYGAPPVNPVSPATPPPAYGQPTTPPPYDQNPQPPQYGQPAYGQASYGQPAYGQPSFPGGPAGDQPSKGMAITAFVLAFFCCAPVSVVLGIIVLRRGKKDGRNHGKGFAISAIIISVIGFLGVAALVAVVGFFASTYSSVEDLSAGQCINADGLSGDGDSVSLIKDVDCTGKHDGQVLATTILTSDQAAEYDDQGSATCSDPVSSGGFDIQALFGQGLDIVALTPDLTPSAGDKLVCVAYNKDGSKLTEKIG